jgi:acyl-CoA thioesterase I
MSIRIWAYEARVAPGFRRRLRGRAPVEWMGFIPALLCMICPLTAACGFANAAPPPSSAPASTPSGASAPRPSDRPTYLADVRALLREKWPKNRIVNIVCHGHSVPAGYFRTPLVRTMDAYPHLLHAAICDAFPYAQTNVIVTAIGGENSESGAARFDRDVLALHPDVITIDYALNDRMIGLDRARKAWRSMIERALAAHVKVILLTPTPDLGAHLDDPVDPLNQHADQIRQLAAEYHVGLADSLAAFKHAIHNGTPLAALMAQSNHPNRKGHELVARELIRWFRDDERASP